jgi:site-specific DNA-methyltransferase (adenine-specific)
VNPEKRIHDAEKPVALIKDIMRYCSHKGEVVFGPFEGSMSTAHAGLELGRHTISIEIDREAIENAMSRGTQGMSLAAYM